VILLMEPKPAIRDELLAHAPGLRRFALSLCGTIDRAEDLVQDTFLQALTHLDSFQPGTNLAAWLVTILRNRFRDQYRRRQREVEDTDGYYAGTLNSQPEQSARIEFAEFRAALAKLPPQQRPIKACKFCQTRVPRRRLMGALLAQLRSLLPMIGPLVSQSN
jgi:RNA polymerase sigma-70 factor, ECF subfamily